MNCKKYFSTSLLYFFSIFAIFMITACTLGPSYQPPIVCAPQKWKGSNPLLSSIPCVAYWWEVFEDDMLNQLEIQAIANNPNLDVAIQRVVEAKALAGVKCADLYPQLKLNPAYNNSTTLFQFPAPAALLPLPTNIKDFRFHQMLYSLPLNMNWELDLWGKTRGQCQSAERFAEAEAESLQHVWLSITTDLAANYFRLRALDAQLVVLEATVNNYSQHDAMIKNRFEKGLVNKLETTHTATELANANAQYEDFKRQRVLQLDAIAILIGIPPSDLEICSKPLSCPPPSIPAGIPSTVIAKRPDIAEAERKMASQHALIGVAYASFLPTFSLTGSLGFSSPILSDFLKWKSRLWAYGTNIGQVIFDAGKNCSNLEATWARYRQTEGTYRQQVLVAFQEVEDALNNIELHLCQGSYLAEAVKWSSEAYQISQNRYQKGLSNSLDVMNTQRSKLVAELNFANVLGMRYLSTVQLIKALGGGWELNFDTGS